MIVNASDLTRTRFCRAQNCGEDAEPYSLFCTPHHRRHRAGINIPLHVQPPPLPPSLKCSKCHQWKPDDAFNNRATNDAGASTDRRGRRSECRDCQALDKRAWSQANREQANARQRARRARGGS